MESSLEVMGCHATQWAERFPVTLHKRMIARSLSLRLGQNRGGLAALPILPSLRSKLPRSPLLHASSSVVPPEFGILPALCVRNGDNPARHFRHAAHGRLGAFPGDLAPSDPSLVLGLEPYSSRSLPYVGLFYHGSFFLSRHGLVAERLFLCYDISGIFLFPLR